LSSNTSSPLPDGLGERDRGQAASRSSKRQMFENEH
jgi:hypothetical protein